MSHEIRTPLNAIIGMAYLLKKANLSQDESKKLDKINLAGKHLLHIINDTHVSEFILVKNLQ